MIEVKDLVKVYGNHTAVDHLNFTLEKGKVYGFLGVNGAGKSTTMNMMTGYLAPTSGTVIIDGHDISEEPEEAKKCIGYLPEIPPLYTDMTVVEYLDFCSEVKKLPKASRKDEVDRVIELTKIDNVATRLIRNLSKGYRQRVGLAQALLGSPEIIILDEPTVGLDPRQIIDIRELIRSLAPDHIVILSSHIMQEVSAVCDYIMVISHGKMVASDTQENLTHLLNGNDTLRIRVEGAKEEVEKALKSLKDVATMKFTAGEEVGTTSVEIHEKDASSDLRKDIFFCLADAKLPILYMNRESISLEDVFLTLTENKEQEVEEA